MVAVAAFGAAGDRLSLGEAGNKAPRLPAAGPGGAGGVSAGLVEFGRIETDQPDPHVSQAQGVAVNRLGTTDELEHGWLQQGGEDGDCRNDGKRGDDAERTPKHPPAVPVPGVHFTRP